MSTSKKGMQPENRPVTANERCLVEWLLQHGNPGSDQFLKQVESLVVVSKCSCGCPTVNFAQEGDPVAQDAEHKHVLELLACKFVYRFRAPSSDVNSDLSHCGHSIRIETDRARTCTEYLVLIASNMP
jgi:hypothetical protein